MSSVHGRDLDADIPFFVVGSPRSGTTVLRLMLSEHSALVIPPESTFVTWLLGDFHSWSQADLSTNRLDVFLNRIQSARKFHTWGLDHNSMKQAILRDQPDSYSKLCSSIYRCYATSIGKAGARWGDKNNHYIHQIELLKSLYPSASFVFLVRDPRDVLASARTLKLQQHKSIYAPRLETDARKFAREWIEQQRIVLRELSLLGSKRSVILQYEQLVTESDLALMPALQLLGVQWQDEILSFWKTNVHKHTEPNATMGWKSLTRHPLTSSRIGQWHALVTEREDAEIKQEARETMIRLGYANWMES